MKCNIYYIVLLLLLCVLPSKAQEQQIDTILNDYQSVVVNEDSTVTFCYCGVAKKVHVEGDFFYKGEDSTRYDDLRILKVKMKRDSDGCFHATTKPLQSELYTYSFKINGKRIDDPLNNDTSWQMHEKWNIVTVGGNSRTALYQKPARQGTVLPLSWFSSMENVNRNVNVYLPAGYNDTLRYPVVYLLHGISGYEGSWLERGRAVQILENLVAEGKCLPFILVMPDVNVKMKKGGPIHRSLFYNLMNYSRLRHDHNIERSLVDLTAFIDSTFSVSDQHYIAGLSDGARIAANASNLMPGYFKAIGFFSPVVKKEQLPAITFAENGYPIPTYYVYSGVTDVFYNNAKKFNKHLEKAQVPHTNTETIGGHTWRNWRIYLSDFLIKISNF